MSWRETFFFEVSVCVWCCAHLLVFCLVWLLCCPTLCALVHFVPCGTNLGSSRHVCVALCTHRASRLVSLGRCTVHLQTLQLTALEAALVHDAVWPPIVAAIACRITCAKENGNKSLQLNLCGIPSSPKPQTQGKNTLQILARPAN